MGLVLVGGLPATLSLAARPTDDLDPWTWTVILVCARARVCVCVCARARARACVVHAEMCMDVCVCVCVCGVWCVHRHVCVEHNKHRIYPLVFSFH